MDYGKEVGRIINERRREQGMTQEQLAEKLGVTYQAVSKWENGLACPDIALLPVIAGVFDTTVDALFGLEAKKAGGTQEGLPWEDDGKLRAVLFLGRTLVSEAMAANSAAQEIRFVYDGPALDVLSQFSVACGKVQGSVTAGGDVECEGINGAVSAGNNVDSGDVAGDVNAGGNVCAASIEGDVTAGSVTVEGDIGGDVTVEGGVTCASVGDNVSAGREVNAADIGGSVKSGASVICADVGGDVTAEDGVTCAYVGGNVIGQAVLCGDVSGSVRAGVLAECGDVEGDILVDGQGDGR